MNNHPDVTRELIRLRHERLLREAEAGRLERGSKVNVPLSRSRVGAVCTALAHLQRAAATWADGVKVEAIARVRIR